MSDLEQRLTDALAQGAQGAPPAIGLATGARARARQRRRTRLAGGAAVVALAVGVPGAVLARGGDGPGEGTGVTGRGTTAVDPVEGGSGMPNGYHAESWHGVTIEVPNTWGYGSPEAWCAGGTEPTDPLIGRPGVTNSIACTPFASYGVTFLPANGNGQEWPVAAQHSDSWPDGTYVGATTVADVVVTVAARESAVTQTVLESARVIGPEGDPNGCGATVDVEPNVQGDAMSVCRYDVQGRLEQSELLDGNEIGEAAAALAAAPPFVGDCIAAPGETVPVVRMRSREFQADVDLGGSCPLVHGPYPDRALTADVVYWALSPGWTGALDERIPLPPELRGQ